MARTRRMSAVEALCHRPSQHSSRPPPACRSVVRAVPSARRPAAHRDRPDLPQRALAPRWSSSDHRTGEESMSGAHHQSTVASGCMSATECPSLSSRCAAIGGVM
jgi:hypothetical protein